MNMEELIKEADWKIFRELQPVLLDRFCQGHLDNVSHIINAPNKGGHQRYLEMFRLTQKFDNLVKLLFDGLRRSDALMKLAGMREAKLVTDEEYARFGEATHRWVEEFLATAK